MFLSYKPPNNLDMSRLKVPISIQHTAQGLNFHHFTLWWAIFELCDFFCKSARKDPKWPWHVQKYQLICLLHAPLGPNFHLFCSTNWLHLSYEPICDKCTKWPQNDLDMFKVKSTHMNTLYIHETQIFIRFTLWWAVCERCTNFVKSAPNDTQMILPYAMLKCIQHTSLRPQFPKELFMGTTLYHQEPVARVFWIGCKNFKTVPVRNRLTLS